MTLQLATPARYFGFVYCAGDKKNSISFYSGSTFIGRFATATLVSLLSTPTVMALDGTTYQSSSYYGKQKYYMTNANEPFAFVNFFSDSGTFDRIVFDNTFTDSNFSGFGSDNHTVSSKTLTTQGSFVRIGSVVVPEGNTAALLGLALPMVGVIRFARRKK